MNAYHLLYLRRKARNWAIPAVALLIFSLLVFIRVPAPGDSLRTPMRALIRAQTACPGSQYDCLMEFFHYTIHNHSTKLFPTFTEFILAGLVGKWTSIGSRAIGLTSWIATLLLITSANRSFLGSERSLTRGLNIYCIFLFTISISLDRFVTVYAIHRTLPALCSAGSALLLWNLNLNKFWKRLQLPTLIVLCTVSLYSFSYGAFLFILVFLSLLVKRSKSAIPFALAMIIAIIPYLFHRNTFRYASDVLIGKTTRIDGLPFSFNDSSIFVFKAILWPITGNISQPLTIYLVALGLTFMSLIYCFRTGWFRGTIIQRTENLKAGLSFYSLLLVNYSGALSATLFYRGYTEIPSRYSIELIMFGVGLAGTMTLLAVSSIRNQFISWAAITFAYCLFWFNTAVNARLASSYLMSPTPSTVFDCLNRKELISPLVVKLCGIDKLRSVSRFYEELDEEKRSYYAKGLNILFKGGPNHVMPLNSLGKKGL